MRNRLASVVFVVALGPAALAGGVRIVDAGGAGQFPSIQAAVEAAVEGDVLLVGEGTYPGFSVDGKGLAILAAPGSMVVVTGEVAISNLPMGSTVVLSGLDVRGQTWQHGIRATSCAGALRIQECLSRGGDDTFTQNLLAGAGLYLEGCAEVSVTRSQLFGGRTWGESWSPSPPGGPGLRALSSVFAVHESQVRGGDGINNQEGASNGGHGCHSSGSWLFAAGSTFRGGNGEHGCEDDETGYGGNGLLLDHPAAALACAFTGGANYSGCWPAGTAPPIEGCCLEIVPGSSRSFDLVDASGDGRMTTVVVRGEPGDRVFLLASDAPGFQFARELSGVWMIETTPEHLTAQPLGVIPPAGILTAEIRLPYLPAGVVREGVFLQGLAVPPAGPSVLGDPSYFLVLGSRSDPDCDQDGVQDYVAVLDGLVPDVNHDLVPDSCQWFGPTWHVDASAPGPGTGAPGAPFPTLGAAFSAASSGHTILVADGVYSGVSNRDLDFAGRDLVVMSVNGPDNCIVDCQSQGRGFVMAGGTLTGAELRGFTVRNGDASTAHAGAAYGRGGGIYVAGPAQPEIRDCVIADCRAQPEPGFEGFGGGMYVAPEAGPKILDTVFTGNSARYAGGGLFLDGASLVRRSTFAGNEVTHGSVYHGGGGIYVWFNASVIDQCLVQGNVSNNTGGGVGMAGSPGLPTVLSHSLILENQALEGGGVAIKGATPSYAAVVHDCLIAGNVGQRGGGAAKFGSTSTHFVHCTFVGNESPMGGAGFRHEFWFETGGTTGLSNCIFWRNLGPNGIQVASSSATSTELRYSLVMGGAAGVSGNVSIGPGLLSGDPLFLDFSGPDGDPSTYHDNDYRLAPGSPCIDAGSNIDVLPDHGDIDEDGDTSEQNPLDLGLQPRFVDDPAAPDTGEGSPPLTDIGAHERQP